MGIEKVRMVLREEGSSWVVGGGNTPTSLGGVSSLDSSTTEVVSLRPVIVEMEIDRERSRP
jgi:hypothetical protein